MFCKIQSCFTAEQFVGIIIKADPVIKFGKTRRKNGPNHPLFRGTGSKRGTAARHCGIPGAISGVRSLPEADPPPPIPYYGKETFEMAACALLQGEHILLTGAKAAGKNILAENLAYLFHRPSYNVFLPAKIWTCTLIAPARFRNNQVELRKGPVYLCEMAALALLMRSIWQRTMQYPCCTRR